MPRSDTYRRDRGRLGGWAVTVVLVVAVAVPMSRPAQADDAGSVWIAGGVTSFALDGGYVHYSTYTGCGTGEFPGTCRVRYTRSNTTAHSSSYTEWSASSADTAEHLASPLAFAGDYLYWIDQGGRVQRLPRYGGGETVVVAPLADPTATGEVASDGQYVYWTENSPGGGGRLYRTRGPGIAPTLLVDNPDRHLRQLQVDGFGGAMYVTTRPVFFLCCLDVLERVTVDGSSGDVTVDRSDEQSIHSYTVDERGVVHFINRFAADPPEVHEAPIEDLTADVVVRTLDDAGDPRFPAMAVADDKVFWQEYRGGQGPIVSMERGGSLTVPISGNLPRVDQLQASDVTSLSGASHLFARAAGDVHRFDLADGGTFLDINGAVRPEVVQVIQSDEHDVPLAAGKRTLVRVYGNLGSVDAGGPRTLELPIPVLLHGTRDGAPLPGSPLRPLSTHPIGTAAIDRTNLDTTFLFELPHDWRHGTITLRSEFNPSRRVVELDHTNNGSARTVTFHETRGVCLDMLPVQTQAGVSEVAWSPEMGQHFARALSMYPVEDFYPIWRGGTPRTIPGTFGDHYDMRDTDHKNLLMMNLNAELGWQGSPAGCGSDRLIRTATVPNSTNFGLSAGIGPYIYTLRSDNVDDPLNAPLGGVPGLAHEVGHQFGFAHVHCPGPGMTGEPGWPYESYPYADDCALDDSNAHIGLDVLSRQLVVPFAADGTPQVGDFNSYNPGTDWTSRYTFDKIWRQVAPGGTALGGVAGAGASVGDEALVVVGHLVSSEADGSVLSTAMAPTNVASGPPLAALRDRLAEVTGPSDRYELRAFDGDGAVLVAEPLTVAPGTHNDGGGARTEFTHLLAPDPAISRVAVVDTADGTEAEVVGHDGGEHAPVVTIDAPVTGDTVGDPLTVRWTSSDADGDTLSHLVRYRVDGAEDWQVLSSGVVGDELVVDTGLLPGGPDSYLEVFASDGVRSTSATVGPFTLPTHAPEVHVLTEQHEAVDPAAGVTIAQSEVLALRAYGYDAEDGQLRGDALDWDLTGPVTRTGLGEELVLTDLPPGSYDLAVTGTDGDGETGTARTTVQVLAKAVNGAAAPVVDGTCDDPGYASDDDPIWLPYGDGTLVALTAVHHDGDVYACVAGLPGDLEDTSTLTFSIDPDASGGAVVGEDDLVVGIGRDNRRTLQFGDGAGGLRPPVGDPIGVRAMVGGGTETWTAEVRLDGDELGSFGPRMRLWIAHQGGSGGALWPAGAKAGVPDAWGLASFGGDVPPVVTVPQGSVTVAATGPEGAVVDYDVSVSDEEDPQGTVVTCEPPSGSTFPIGTTTVVCTAVDGAGNRTVATFEVTVEATVWTDKQSVRDELKALLPTGDRKADRAIGDAVAALDEALDARRWEDGERLAPDLGKKVFDLEKSAVDALASVVGHRGGIGVSEAEVAVVGDAIAALVGVDERLAANAIGDAEAALIGHADGDGKDLAKGYRALERAYEEADRAATERDRGRASQAIVRSRQAWFRAQQALAWAEAASG